jgi:uncharacterized glyoxalase superfamily protein PhnB
MKLSVDLTVSDVAKAAAFYRALGVEVPQLWEQDGVAHHVEAQAGFMLNSRELTKGYDPSVPSVILIFDVDDRESVDAKHAELVGAGYASHLEPFDAFWGSRYAIVDDPDGNHVGIMGPQDQEHKTAPIV